jgi:hypothetical protein
LSFISSPQKWKRIFLFPKFFSLHFLTASIFAGSHLKGMVEFFVGNCLISACRKFNHKTEGMGLPYLAEEHGNKLAPAGKSPSMTLWVLYVCEIGSLAESNLSYNSERAYFIEPNLDKSVQEILRAIFFDPKWEDK